MSRRGRCAGCRMGPSGANRPDESRGPAWMTRWSAVLWLTAGVTALRVVYIAWLCPYTLIEDEAHYWEWSRRLEWSYYSKGPGVAWAIALSDWFWAQLGVGTSEFTVRFAAVLMSALLTVGVAGLARAVTGDRRAGWYAAVLTLMAPALWFGGMLMTIDIPYAACWALAAWAGWLALRRGSKRAWLGLGAALGAGVLFKYTILLLVPGILIWAWKERARLRLGARWRMGLAAACGLFALGLAPVVIWNATHGWATVHHLLGHLGLAGGDVVDAKKGWSYDPAWTGVLLASQLAMMSLVLGVILVAALRAHRLKRADPEGSVDRLYLLLCAAPIFVFYLLVSFIAEPEGNWPLAGYITLIALAGWGTAAGVDEWKEKMGRWRADGRKWRGMFLPRPETVDHLLWRLAVLFGVLVALATARADWVMGSGPAQFVQRIAREHGWVKADRPLIPLGRLMGADRMARHAARLRDEVTRQTGREAFVIGQQYGRASLLAFYMPGRPTVYCSSAKSEGRKTQYDMWPQTDLNDPGLRGRPAVLVGGKLAQWEPAFERILSLQEFDPHEPANQLEGETKKDRLTFIGIGYRGFPTAGAQGKTESAGASR